MTKKKKERKERGEKLRSNLNIEKKRDIHINIPSEIYTFLLEVEILIIKTNRKSIF